MPSAPGTSLPSEVVDAALSDPAVRARATSILNQLFNLVEQTIQFGTNTDKMSLMRAVVPAMLKSIQSAQQSAEAEEQRAVLDDMKLLVAQFGSARPE